MMNLLTQTAERPGAAWMIQKNFEDTDAEVYPLSLEKTITSTTGLAAINAADMILGTTLVLQIDGGACVYRLHTGTDAHNPPRVVRPNDYSTANRVWKMIPVQAWGYCAENGKYYPTLVRLVNGIPQPYVGAPI